MKPQVLYKLLEYSTLHRAIYQKHVFDLICLPYLLSVFCYANILNKQQYICYYNPFILYICISGYANSPSNTAIDTIPLHSVRLDADSRKTTADDIVTPRVNLGDRYQVSSVLENHP